MKWDYDRLDQRIKNSRCFYTPERLRDSEKASPESQPNEYWSKVLPAKPGFYWVILTCPSILVEPRSIVELIEVCGTFFVKFLSCRVPQKSGSEVVHLWGPRVGFPPLPK